MAVDGAGNLYISDLVNNQVRKVTVATGTITTVTANDGLSQPTGLAIDAVGNLYIGDSDHSRVVKVTAGGFVTTVAGIGTEGYSGDGGPAIAAQLDRIQGLAIDLAGNLYIADAGNGTVRKIDTQGVITTLAGTGVTGYSGDSGPATAAQLSSPQEIAVDRAGNVYVADSGNNRVRQITSTGTISTIAGGACCNSTGDGGPALLGFVVPTYLALDSAGNLYVTDRTHISVRLLTPLATQPLLMVFSSHAGSFTAGQTGAYTLTVTNAAYAGSTSGTVTLSEVLPSWLTIASMQGTGWSCSGTSCTRSDALAGGLSYPAVTVTVNVASTPPSQVTNQATVSGGGAIMTGTKDFTLISIPASLSITKTHAGNFMQGQINATYAVTVSNQAGATVTSGAVTVTENVSTGLALISMSGTGWSCSANTCTRSDALAGGASYPVLTVTVEVSASATALQVNSVTVSGGGSASANTTDPTVINSASCTFSISPASATFGVAGGTGSVTVTAPSECSWTASTTQTWLSVTRGAPGSGNGTVSFTVAANGGAPRVGYLAIAGQTFAVSQSAGYLINTIGGGQLVPATAAQPGTSANLRWPQGVAVDVAGNIYFAGYVLNSVYKLDTSGVLTRVAGTGIGGYSGDNGPALAAALWSPNGVATDASGDLYIADYVNFRVRKVTSSGIITTVAGVGTDGDSGDNGPATSAQFSELGGLAVDSAGNLYIADTASHRVRKVAPNGIITTVAGTGVAGYSGDNGPATSAQLNSPYAIIVDAGGNLFIADAQNNRIRKVSPGGVITTVAGAGGAGFSGDTGPAVSAQLNFPEGVALDSGGNLYIADTGNYRVREVATSGIITTVAGNGTNNFAGDNGPATSAEFSSITAVAVTPSGDLIVSDPSDFRIRKICSGIVTTVAGGSYGNGGPAPSLGLSYPTSVARDNTGNLYVTDRDNSRVIKIAPNGIVTTVAGTGSRGYSGDNGPAASAQLGEPEAAIVDGNGNLYIADSGNNVVRQIVASTGIITTVPISGGLNGPTALALDGAGNLYIGDSNNNRVRKMTAGGIVTTVAGNGTTGYSGDGGPATAAQLGYFITGLATDTSGSLYISDYIDKVIRKVDNQGVITTFAGGGTAVPGDGGPAASAQLSGPWGLAFDGLGNLFVADVFRIRQITSSGIISTVVGESCCTSSSDGGPALFAQNVLTAGLTVDSSGNLYLPDLNHYSLRILTPVATQPVLTVASAHSGSFTAGQTGVYTLTVTNAASAGSTSGTVTLSEVLPSWLTIASMQGTGWNCSGTSCTRSDALSGGASYPPVTVSVNVAAGSPSQVTNQATLAGGNGPMTGTQDFTLITPPPALLSITKTHTGNFTQGLANAVYSVTIANPSAATSTSGIVTVTESVPSGLTLVSMSGAGWTCSGNTCTRSDSLAAGASYPVITVTVNVATNATSPQVNSVSASGGGSATASATDSTTIVAVHVLSIGKTHTGNFMQGQNGATYTVTVSNGTSAGTSGTVTVTETVPSGLNLVSMAGAGWTCVANTCSRNDSLAGGSSYPVITVTVNVAANASSPQINQANVSGGGFVGASTSDSTTIIPGIPFFAGSVNGGGGTLYLQFPSGTIFGYYGFLSGGWMFHVDMGYEYVSPGNGPEVYLWDMASGHWWYTNTSTFPYLYDFSLNTWLYYFADSKNPGHYTTNPRYFANMTTGKIFTM